MKATLSYTGLNDWLSCRRKFWYKYRERLEPIGDVRAPALGSCVHRALEAYLRGDTLEYGVAQWKIESEGIALINDENDGEETFDFGVDRTEFLNQICFDALIVAQNMLNELHPNAWAVCHFQDGKPMLEASFAVKGYGQMQFVGRIDVVLREIATGHLFLTEFKTRAQLTDDTAEMLDLQKPLYQRALQELGYPITGTMVLQGLSKVPRKPSLNQNGSVSKRPIITTQEIYMDAILDAGEDPSDYQDILAKIGTREWARLSRVYRSKQEIANIWQQILIPAARQIVSVTEETAVRSLSHYTCKQCAYMNLCLAELRGDDSTYIRATEFVERN